MPGPIPGRMGARGSARTNRSRMQRARKLGALGIRLSVPRATEYFGVLGRAPGAMGNVHLIPAQGQRSENSRGGHAGAFTRLLPVTDDGPARRKYRGKTGISFGSGPWRSSRSGKAFLQPVNQGGFGPRFPGNGASGDPNAVRRGPWGDHRKPEKFRAVCNCWKTTRFGGARVHPIMPGRLQSWIQGHVGHPWKRPLEPAARRDLRRSIRVAWTNQGF